MTPLQALIIGLLIGAGAGYIIAALMMAAKQGDE